MPYSRHAWTGGNGRSWPATIALDSETQDTQRSRGFAFVEMGSNQQAAEAIRQFNGREFPGPRDQRARIGTP